MLRLGDKANERDWGDDLEGRISNSEGPMKVPILVHSTRSCGDEMVLDNFVLRIASSDGRTVFYQAPNYQTPTFPVGEPHESDRRNSQAMDKLEAVLGRLRERETMYQREIAQEADLVRRAVLRAHEREVHEIIVNIVESIFDHNS